MRAAVDSFKQSKKEQCEFEVFGNYLASELRSLEDIPMARRIKSKLNRFFLDAVDEEKQQMFILQDVHYQTDIDQN